MNNNTETRMWANAQRDSRPAEYRWRPLFNAAVWLTPTTRVPCSNAAKTPNPLKFAGVPQTRQRISAASGRTSPYYQNMWTRRYCCLTIFPIVDTCLSCEDTARQSIAMVPRWRFFASCIFTTFQACILNSHQGHTMCGSMVDIQSATAEIRRRKKERRRKKKQNKNIHVMVCLIT